MWLFQGLAAYFLYTKGKDDAEKKLTDAVVKELEERQAIQDKVDAMSDQEVFDFLKTKPSRPRDPKEPDA